MQFSLTTIDAASAADHASRGSRRPAWSGLQASGSCHLSLFCLSKNDDAAPGRQASQEIRHADGGK
jgi:hypothetical protein